MQRVIKKNQVNLTLADSAAANAGHAHAMGGAGLRLIRVEGKVQAIEVTCACGDVMLLEIDYGDAAAAAAASETPT